MKTYKDVVHCGDTIMLQHSLTQGRLRTFDGATGLTSVDLQFVHSQRGDPEFNNNWKVVCSTKEVGEALLFNDEFRMMHIGTHKYVRFSNVQVYSEYNCGRGCSLVGQLELHAIKEAAKDSLLKAVGGITIVDK